jgi:hypothetical protein
MRDPASELINRVERHALGGEQDLDEHDGGELERDAEHVERHLAVRRDGDARRAC